MSRRDGEFVAGLGVVCVDRHDMPVHDISARLQRMREAYMQSVCRSGRRLADWHGLACGRLQADAGKGDHDILGEVQFEFTRALHGLADARRRMIENGMSRGRCRKSAGETDAKKKFEEALHE